MIHSHPDRWLFAGILIRTRWTGEPVDLPTTAETIERVEHGDQLLMLRTAACLQLVEVLQRAPKEVVA